MVRIFPCATNTVVINFEQLAANVLDLAVDVILLDTTFWGGIRPCIKAAGVCETFQLGIAVHSSGELGIQLGHHAAPRRGPPNLSFSAKGERNLGTHSVPGQRRGLLRRHIQRAATPPPRGDRDRRQRRHLVRGRDGEIYRISADGSGIETVASTGGFILGLAFDGDQNLYACDMRHSAVFRLDTRTGDLVHFANGGGGAKMRIPNFPVVDGSRNCLYVSDSYDPKEQGPGIWRFDLESGEGGLWYDRAMTFANGMSLSPDKDHLYVAESFAGRVIPSP